jgi:hypothetical protein
MGTEEGGRHAPEAGLQFDNVEHAAPEAARACARCTRQITDEYYEIGGQVLCPPARARYEAVQVARNHSCGRWRSEVERLCSVRLSGF